MQHLIELINGYGIPTDGGANTVAQYLGVSGNGIGQQKDSWYVDNIEELTGVKVTETNSDILRITHSYLICAIVELVDAGNHTELTNLVKVSERRANKMFVEQPWHFAKPEADPKLDGNGQVKAKKGSKKILAQEVYDKDIKDKGLSRKEAIAILVEAGVSTPAGSSTYYAKLKKGEL